MKSQLDQTIDDFWALCRSALGERVDLSPLPAEPSVLVRGFVDGQVKLSQLSMTKRVKLENLETRRAQDAAKEILKLFDASVNGYRSVTNVLLEFLKLQRELGKGAYDLHLERYAALDGFPLLPAEVSNTTRCPICNLHPHELQAYALITGNPQTDSHYQTYQAKHARGSMQVCGYCFAAGWVDLPTTCIIKDGNSINKERDYLFITTPLSRQRLEKLLEVIEQQTQSEEVTDDELVLDDHAQQLRQDTKLIMDQLLGEWGIELGDPLAVLGISLRRLRELRGFVLQGSNPLLRTIVLRVPTERLASRDKEFKVSSAVQRELMKATMYDLWRVVGGSMHYRRVRPDVPYSIEGHAVSIEEMRCANQAYRIIDSYGRVGKDRQLNSGLFMLLLARPREATNRILRSKKREKSGRYAPNNQKVREIIEVTEELAGQADWQFQLGLKIVATLVDLGLAPRARGFWKNKNEQYSGVELAKWLQRLKMMHDENSARAWGTSLINGFRRELGRGPNAEQTQAILTLVEEIVATCHDHNVALRDFSRTVADMDYYLLFYHNQQSAQAAI